MRHCFALDLKEDPQLIAAYDTWHQQVWPGILNSIKESGITEMEIYRTGNRLFMVMETNAQFDPDLKAAADAANPEVQQWEALMWQYQQAIPHAQPGQKWIPMQLIFQLA